MDFFNLDVLTKLPIEEQIKIKKMTINTNELSTIPVAYLPDVATTEYFFISYSHIDYKEVYSDLFDLQQNGLSVWYDRGIPAGNDWKEIANKFIAPFSCKGTIFYISEHSLKSDSVKMEIESALSYNKPFLVILVSNKNVSLKDLIERLKRENKISEDRYNFYLKIFKEEVIYLSINEPSATKVEKIINSIPKQKILSISECRVLGCDKEEVINNKVRPDSIYIKISGLNDFYVSKITINDYLDLIDKDAFDNEDIRDSSQEFKQKYEIDYSNPINEWDKLKIVDVDIDAASFANLPSLEYFEYPIANPVGITPTIGSFAFYRCKKLKEFTFVKKRNHKGVPIVALGESTFHGCVSLESFDFDGVIFGNRCFAECKSLKEIDLSNAFCHYENKSIGKDYQLSIITIPSHSFFECKSLNKVIFPNKLEIIDEGAFFSSGLESVSFPLSLRNIKESAFAHCLKLSSVELNEGIETIDECAFAFTAIESITLPSSLLKVEANAFLGCNNLKKVIYKGNRDQFEKVVDLGAFCYCKNIIEVLCDDVTN